MRIFILFSMFFLSSILLYAQSIPEPVVNVTFDANGVVVGGKDGANHKGKSYNLNSAKTLLDPQTNRYLGVTNYDASGYFYINYDADDALGKCFGKEVTWELLFRLDNPKANGALTTASKKLFSSQESGGWSIIHDSSKGIRLEYVTTGSKINYVYSTTNDMVTGSFYHIVVTVNKSTNVANIFINGECVAKNITISSDDFMFGNFGNPRREKNLWFCLGGDPSGVDSPASCQNSARATYVFANIYDKALSRTNIQDLVNSNLVQYYVSPTKPSPNNDLILDAVFQKDGKCLDRSPFKAMVGVNRKPLTQYNASQHRYEGSCKTPTALNFFYRDFYYDPWITKQLGESHSFEIYCKTNGEYPDHMCPLSNQQDGGFGLQFKKTEGVIGVISNTAGYHTSAAAMEAGLGTNYISSNDNTNYTHYIYVFDHSERKVKLYVNGTLEMTKTFDINDNLCFPFATYQWFGIMADTKAVNDHVVCDYPFVGDMSIARVWGKALTYDEIKLLYKQTHESSNSISIGTEGCAALCLPYATIVPAGLKAYAPVAKNDNQLVLGQLADAGEAVEYGTPFIIKGSSGTYQLEAADLSVITPKVTGTDHMEGSFLPKLVDAYDFRVVDGKCILSHTGKLNKVANSGFIAYDGKNATLELVFSDSIIVPPAPPVAPEDTVYTGNNIKGRITCEGVGVEGVKVSDGIEIVKTDKEGYYEFRSEKMNGYVFYTIPSGYMPYQKANATTGEKIFLPFWQKFVSKSPNTKEEHNFELQVENNDEFYFLVGADSHLANRYNDVQQFEAGYIKRVKEEKARADEANLPIYSTVLGDNAWDAYWYSNGYGLSELYQEYLNCDYPMPLFPCMGNHDNDGATPGGTDETDFEASWKFRDVMSPNYYSVDLGKVHYIVMDDIFYLNTGTASGTGCVGSRNYKGYIPYYQLEWLRKDLEDVDKDTPIIVGLHIPVWNRHTTVLDSCYAYLTYPEIGVNSSVDMCELLKDFKTVHILSGHTHWNHHVHPVDYPNIHENNIAAICAIWWYSGYKTGWHNCRDGVPGGYEMFHIKGKDIKYKYHSIEYNGDAQFHVLDINTVKDYYKKNMAGFLQKYTAFTNFGTWNDNMLLLNVFNYDNDWKIEITENGKSLVPVRQYIEDPYHMLTYDIPYYNSGSTLGTDARATKNTHMFKVQCATATSPVTIRVTDSFGEVYEQIVKRPVGYSLAAIDTSNTIVTSIKEKVVEPEESIKIISGNGVININAKKTATAYIVGIDGKYQKVEISEGNNTIPVSRRGIYIIKIDGVSKKLFVR